MHPNTVTVDQMRERLLSLDTVKETLASTEPLSTVAFTVGEQVRFTVEPGWQHGVEAKASTDLVDASVHIGPAIGGSEIPLTKAALLEATAVAGLSQPVTVHTPAEWVEGFLNHNFRGGLAERRGKPTNFQVLVAAGAGAAITRGSITPFSNVHLLDEVVAGVRDKFGDVEILADYKFVHQLRRTHLRLIVPGVTRTITGTGHPDDEWSMGVQLINSLTGAEKTQIDGYLFRWLCTNGQTETRGGSGVWTRRGAGREEDVYEWARLAVDNVLGGLEPALDAVQALTDIPVTGDASELLRDLFTTYKVPLPERARIIDNVVDAAGDLTMYSILAAVTQVANTPDLDPGHVESLMRIGGEITHSGGSRCNACRRMLPHD